MARRYGYRPELVQATMPSDYHIDYSYTRSGIDWTHQFDQLDGRHSKSEIDKQKVWKLQFKYGCLNVTSGKRSDTTQTNTCGVWADTSKDGSDVTEHRPDHVGSNGISKMCRCFG